MRKDRRRDRPSLGNSAADFVATVGLLAANLGTLRWRPRAVCYAVGLYITAAYWFTASTSFANPAVIIARGLSNTFSGIAPTHVTAFILAQLFGAVAAVLIFGWLMPGPVPAQDRPPDMSA